MDMDVKIESYIPAASTDRRVWLTLPRILMRLALVVVLAAGWMAVGPAEAVAGEVLLVVEPSRKPITRDTVRMVQRMLVVHGYNPGTVDGLTGRKTKVAVLDYQRLVGLPTTGKIDRRLVNRLSRDTVKMVQRMLALQGYDPGRMNGLVGSKTKKAIHEYKTRAGLPANARISRRLFAKLSVDTTKYVQRMLTARGYDTGPADGVAGKKTQEAIREYQTRAGIPADGKVSMSFVGHLWVETVKLLQSMLAARGFDAGPIDGDAGDKTVAAIRAYQAQAGLPVDGRYSLDLVEQMNASSGGSARGTDYAKSGDVVIGYTRGDIEPIYEVGDSFAYSDGRIDTVLRVGGNRVWWSSSNGESYTTYRNFLLPRVSSQDESGSSESMVDIDVDEAWLSTTRKRVSFRTNVFRTAAGTTGTAEKSTETWSCRRNAGMRIAVTVGIFETIPLVCERSGVSRNDWHRRVWYYAPAVRHYVRLDEVSGDETRRVELVAVRPGGRGWPPAARAGLDRAVQDTLENMPTGEEVKWGSTAIGAKFGIRPTSESGREGGGRCRTYVLIRSDADNPRLYPAVACRAKKSESWFVSLLDKERGTVLADQE